MPCSLSVVDGCGYVAQLYSLARLYLFLAAEHNEPKANKILTLKTCLCIGQQVDNMSSFIDRLLAEEAELNDRKAKLQTFIEGENFKGVAREQQALLKIQLNAMATYSECLNQRLIQINNTQPVGAE